MPQDMFTHFTSCSAAVNPAGCFLIDLFVLVIFFISVSFIMLYNSRVLEQRSKKLLHFQLLLRW